MCGVTSRAWEEKGSGRLAEMVGAEGFEPPTLCSQSRCATRLRYAPISFFDCNPDRFSSTRPARPLDPSQAPRIWMIPRQVCPALSIRIQSASMLQSIG